MKIKDYLEKSKKRQAEFARDLGCSSGALSLWISGDRTPSPAMARKIVQHTKGQVGYADLYGQPAKRQHEREAA